MRSQVLARLRTLRIILARARDQLMHYQDDRVDRDKLETAARRIDSLMDMFSGESHDGIKAAAWVGEILSGVDQVTNPKSAEALSAARLEIPLLLEELVHCAPSQH